MKRLGFIVLAASACGEADPPAEFHLEVPWQATQVAGCPGPGQTDLSSRMQAILEIGGHTPCVLTVDPSTLAVSGTCPAIRTQCFRPLALGYWLPDAPNVQRAPLAYLIGWVDLRVEALDPNATTVQVALVNDGTNGELVYTDGELASFPNPSGTTSCLDPGPRGLNEALIWGKEHLTSLGVDFDLDDNATPNLEEACAGTLF